MNCEYTIPGYTFYYNSTTGEGTITPTTPTTSITCDEGNFATSIATGTQEFLIKKQYTYGDITTELFLGFFILIFIAYFLIKVFTRQDVYLKR